MTRGTGKQIHTATVINRSSANDPVITMSTPIQAVGAHNGPPTGYTDNDDLSIFIIARQKGHGPNVSNLTRKINVYSFALKPEEHQPSGTCNFSRIDNAQLMFNTANGETFNVYAVNYNVLRIMSGMGGLAYSN